MAFPKLPKLAALPTDVAPASPPYKAFASATLLAWAIPPKPVLMALPVLPAMAFPPKALVADPIELAWAPPKAPVLRELACELASENPPYALSALASEFALLMPPNPVLMAFAPELAIEVPPNVEKALAPELAMAAPPNPLFKALAYEVAIDTPPPMEVAVDDELAMAVPPPPEKPERLRVCDMKGRVSKGNTQNQIHNAHAHSALTRRLFFSSTCSAAEAAVARTKPRARDLKETMVIVCWLEVVCGLKEIWIVRASAKELRVEGGVVAAVLYHAAPSIVSEESCIAWISSCWYAPLNFSRGGTKTGLHLTKP